MIDVNAIKISPEVIVFFDFEDAELWETVEKYARDPAGTHVYEAYPESGMYVVSPRPLHPRKVQKHFKEHVIGLAAEEMRSGATPQQIRDWFGLSGQQIGRIARKLGIKLPYRWFLSILATEKQRENDAAKAISAA